MGLVVDRPIAIPVENCVLDGQLSIPDGPTGIVIFVHGSGSSRKSPRNQAVATALQNHGQATLLFDLLSVEEEANRENVFDVDLLASRLDLVTDWVQHATETKGLPIGYFGASTGAAAALISASRHGDRISAVVSRGGRADLATSHLTKVRAPTLLIVGGNDPVVIELNRAAQRHLRCNSRLDIVPSATHLFEEPGTLDEVSRLAADWFDKYFRASGVLTG